MATTKFGTPPAYPHQVSMHKAQDKLNELGYRARIETAYDHHQVGQFRATGYYGPGGKIVVLAEQTGERGWWELLIPAHNGNNLEETLDALVVYTNGSPTIRPDIKEAIDLYAQDGDPNHLGGFLQAVMEDEIGAALHIADSYNSRTLKEIVAYVKVTVPLEFRGTKQKVWSRNKLWPAK